MVILKEGLINDFFVVLFFYFCTQNIWILLVCDLRKWLETAKQTLPIRHLSNPSQSLVFMTINFLESF